MKHVFLTNKDSLWKVYNEKIRYETYFDENNNLVACRVFDENGKIDKDILYYKNGRRTVIEYFKLHNTEQLNVSAKYYYNKKGNLVLRNFYKKDGKVESKTKYNKDESFKVRKYKEFEWFDDYNFYVDYYDKCKNKYMRKYFDGNNKNYIIELIENHKIALSLCKYDMSKGHSAEEFIGIANKCLEKLFKSKDKAPDIKPTI